MQKRQLHAMHDDLYIDSSLGAKSLHEHVKTASLPETLLPQVFSSPARQQTVSYFLPIDPPNDHNVMLDASTMRTFMMICLVN